MGVYIKNEEKPKSCAECEFEVIDTSGYPRCVIMQEMVVDGNLFNRCPLEEIDLVRCKECKYWHEGEWNSTCDKHIGHGFPSDYFCGDGERRNDERITE